MDTANMGAEGLTNGAVTVGNTAALFLDQQHNQQRSIAVQNLGAVAVYFGGTLATCTTALGWQVPAGAVEIFNVKSPLWAIATSGTCDVRWLVEAA